MANNRIYLKCNICGDVLYLGKSFAMGYYWENYGKINGDPNSPSLEDRLNKFFDEHTYCKNEGNDGDYSIEYEDPIRDYVDVVRCGRCQYWENQNSYCNRIGVTFCEKDYCSWGKDVSEVEE